MNKLTPEDEFLLEEFRKAIRINNSEDVIDLDSKFIHKFDFQIQRVEDLVARSIRAVPPNRWSYYRIGLFTQGSVDFLTGIYKFRATKNTLIVMPTRIITSSQLWTPDAKGYIVLFNPNFFLKNNFPHQFIGNRKILHPAIKPYIQVTEVQTEELTAIFEDMIAEKIADNKGKVELIALKIAELLIHCERLFEMEEILHPPMAAGDVIKRFIHLLDKHHSREHAVLFYAGRLSVHPNHLNTLIKKHTGLSTKEIIQNRLLLETKYLLHSTNLSIKEISNKMGFSDPNYFTTFFKRLEKISPATYRSTNV